MNESIHDKIAALPADEIRTPNLPMAHALQEAVDLHQVCQQTNVKKKLLAVGQAPSFLEDLKQRIAAAREAQSAWITARDMAKSADLVAAEAQATALRSDLIAACRFNLKGREDHARLSQITVGEAVADLVQDLFDLAMMIEKNPEAFLRDHSFDAATRRDEARALAQQLSDSISAERNESDPNAARDLRDRAFSYMDQLVSELRAAGRYAFRLDPVQSKHFASRYRRRARGTRSKRNDVVPEEVVGEITASV